MQDHLLQPVISALLISRFITIGYVLACHDFFGTVLFYGGSQTPFQLWFREQRLAILFKMEDSIILAGGPTIFLGTFLDHLTERAMLTLHFWFKFSSSFNAPARTALIAGVFS